MATSYSVAVCRYLEKKFSTYNLNRPIKVGHYDEGRQLTYTMTTVDAPAKDIDVTLKIERFVGGGFAGQVYKVRILDINADDLTGIVSGNTYAMKILIPPSGFSLMFRNLLFAIGFQGSFQLQTNPVAARCGALWQKLIQRAAESRYGGRASVNSIHATFVDSTLGSCGELSDWVEGRTWQLEVDDRVDLLSKWERRKKVDIAKLGSPEFRAKKEFMHDFVVLLHEMGAHEFARQYEWSTWKSQPNCLKMISTDNTPEKGLVAVDFRAGLALLPFLPMSPGDVKLIFQGLLRGSLVQFDRGNLATLKSFIHKHKDIFTDLLPLVEELEKSERIYRDSIPDITHNHFRLLFSRRLWSTILRSSRTGCRITNTIDEGFERSLKKNTILSFVFWIIGLVPFLGKIGHRLIGHRSWRKHYFSLLNPSYFIRALKGKMAEKAIAWHRGKRLDETKAKKIADSIGLFCIHLPLSFLPAGLHHLFSSWSYFKERVDYVVRRPFRLYFNASLREEWLREMVDDGLRKRIITKDDALEIFRQLQEPYIQKYLKSLAVHVMTLPITQVVSVIVAVVYVLSNPELSWQEASGSALLIIASFQVVPVSPGSLARGLYVVWLVIRERNFKDYNIAVILAFLKYVGYLAFPIQMTYRYPTIARFMAAHWATEAVHVIPVFGESGALLEHKIFGVFYNWPLTIRRRMKLLSEVRQTMSARWWHMVPIVLCSTGALYGIDRYYLLYNDTILGFKGILSFTFSGIKQLISQLTSLKLPAPGQLAALVHYLPFGAALIVGGLTGCMVTMGCRGAKLNKRIALSALAGVVTGLLYTSFSGYLSVKEGIPVELFPLITGGIWKMFGYTIATTTGAIIAELSVPEPAAK